MAYHRPVVAAFLPEVAALILVVAAACHRAGLLQVVEEAFQRVLVAASVDDLPTDTDPQTPISQSIKHIYTVPYVANESEAHKGRHRAKRSEARST